jgi:hypothetical protein
MESEKWAKFEQETNSLQILMYFFLLKIAITKKKSQQSKFIRNVPWL